MRLKFFSQITLAFLLLVCTAHTVHAISTLGGNPFYQPPLSSVSDLRNMVMEKQDDVKAGLVKVGQGELFDSLNSQLPDVDVATVEYKKGQTLQWMFYRKDGKGAVRVDKDVVWESDTPFTGYEFFIDHDGQRYTFVVPLVCGNLALMAVDPVPVSVTQVPVAVPVAIAPVDPSVSMASAGSPGSGVGSQAAVEKTMIPLLFDVGYMHQLDPAHHLLVRGGLEHNFNDNFSLIGMVGAAAKYTGLEGKSAFIADLTVNYNWSRMFVGFGLGAWITSGDSDIKHEDSDLDLILNFGVRIFGEPDAFNTSLFFEVRSGVDELDEFDLYGKLGVGLRFRF